MSRPGSWRGLFHRSLLETVGGYSTTTVGEDFEITLRLHHHLRPRGEPYRIAFISDPVCLTEVPEQLRTLGRQRRRWQRGLWEGLRRHQRMLGNPRYGTVGLLAMPYFAVFEFLSPVSALTGLSLTVILWLIGDLSTAYFGAFLLVSLGLGVLVTTAALLLEAFSYHRYQRPRDICRLLAYAVVENIGYHQLNDIRRAVDCADIARRTTGWGQQQRRGFSTPPSPADFALDNTPAATPSPAPDRT
jgi:cellulose synthase/poly-beta-1,6-N-acetylglucosamine synthase-like glycosyltransferase